MRRALLWWIATAIVAAGCAPSTERRDQDREAIGKLLADYRGSLSEAYRTGSAEPLREVATEREVARVDKQIADLAAAGRQLSAAPVSDAIQSIEFNRTSATATVNETWNLKVLATGSETLLSESPAQQNEVLYSLTRDGGRWWILSRILTRSSED